MFLFHELDYGRFTIMSQALLAIEIFRLEVSGNIFDTFKSEITLLTDFVSMFFLTCQWFKSYQDILLLIIFS